MAARKRSKVRLSCDDWRYWLVGAVIIIILLFFFLQIKQSLLPAEQHFDSLLYERYGPPKSLREDPLYKNGFVPAPPLQEYLALFTNKKEAMFTKLIEFQKGLNGINTKDTLAIDKAMASSISNAAEKVTTATTLFQERERCGKFNALLNPSLLVMDLTLWTGKSGIYTMFQEHKEVGERCLFYYPQLSHGMLTFDPKTGRIVQRTVFCDDFTPSSCFGVWDYFWKFALEPVNYGTGCTLTDWMNQGFICVNGVNLKSFPEGKIERTLAKKDYSGNVTGILKEDITQEFVNSLGASGKLILENVKQKCSQVKGKALKYGSYGDVLTLESANEDSGLTGAVISTEMAKSGNTEENVQLATENAMLFASLFTEACLLDIDSFRDDLFGADGSGGSFGGGLGINRPRGCQLAEVEELGKRRQCLSNFASQLRAEQWGKLLNLESNAVSDLGCVPSALDSGAKGIPCGPRGAWCGRDPTPEEDENIRKMIEQGQQSGQIDPIYSEEDMPYIRVINSEEREELCKNENGEVGLSCGGTVEADGGQHGIIYIFEDYANADPNAPTEAVRVCGDGKKDCYYTVQEVVNHEVQHAQHPERTDDEVRAHDQQTTPGYDLDDYDQDGTPNDEDDDDDGDGIPDEEDDDDDGDGTPDVEDTMPGPDGEDECSSQAERFLDLFDAAQNCFNQGQGEFLASPPYGRGPTPDPAPDDVGGLVVNTCEQTSYNFWNGKPGVTDCMTDDVCQVGIGPVAGIANPKCQYVENQEGMQCPFK